MTPSGGLKIEFAGAIDRASPVPYYFQLRRLLEEQIRTGRWKTGEQLPSEPALSDHFKLARTTVRQALNALEQDGLIRKEKGRGAFVARSQPGSWMLQSPEGFFEDEAGREGMSVESTVLRMLTEPLPEWASKLLALPAGASGITLERLRRVEGRVAMYVVNHLPWHLSTIVQAVVDDPTSSLYVKLREEAGLLASGSSRVLEAVPAKGELTRLLEVPRGYPLVNIESVTWDAEHQPFDCYRAWLRTDRTRIVVDTQTRPISTGGHLTRSLTRVSHRDTEVEEDR
jgi:GntR family transcriptional regulator